MVAQQAQPEVDEVLADAGADVEQVRDRRVDVGRAPAVLEALGDQLGQQQQRVERRRGGPGRREQLGQRGVPGSVVGLQQELAAGFPVAGVAQRLPRRRRAARAPAWC